MNGNVIRTNNMLRDKRIAIIGYGSQGHAHALNLLDSGLNVVVGLRPKSIRRDNALSAGLVVRDIPQAVSESDVVMILVPDEVQPSLFAEQISPNLKPGTYLGFAHGLAVHFKKIEVPPHINVFLAAPRGPGRLIRRLFEQKAGFACSIAVARDVSGDTRNIATAYAKSLGAIPGAIYQTTFEEECQADLFGEQAVLCGGLVELIRAGYETLTEAGFSPEMAYFECLHEVKLIADLLCERGIAGMRSSISTTARFGGLTRGSRIIGEEVRTAMKSVLKEIQSGQFANELLSNPQETEARIADLQKNEADHPIEEVGAEIRKAIQGSR